MQLPGVPIALRDCLAGAPAGARRQVLDAFWLARQLAAECQTLSAEQGQLTQLVGVAVERGSRPGGDAEGLRLHAATLAVEADLCRSQVSLLESQFELTRLLGRSLDKDWSLPITPPHAGPYNLNLDALPPRTRDSQPIRRLAMAVPALWVSVQQRAAGVIDADAARAATTATYQTGTRSIDPLLPCVEQQAMETLALLETLTAYNRAIADYVLTVVPETIPADQLLQTLVLAN